MAIKKITIQAFLELSTHNLVLDARSPGEYRHAHMRCAYSLPLFSDEERKIIGTAYKQKGKQVAVKLGLDFFSVKMKQLIDDTAQLVKQFNKESSHRKTNLAATEAAEPSQGTVLVHCWRGGMRSAAVAWLLDLYGFDVYTLTGGYKAYRNWVVQQFDKAYNLQLVGGYTGSGKTELLARLSAMQQQVTDLEQLAKHKGSAFGAMGDQPTQEMFENLLAEHLSAQDPSLPIWIEDESQRIGQITIPGPFWKTMRDSPVYFLDISFEQRLEYIISHYGLTNKEHLVTSIIRIQKRLGPLETKTAIGFLLEDDYKECFEILLRYYDKYYKKGLDNRNDVEQQLTIIPCSHIDSISNTEKILTCLTVKG